MVENQAVNVLECSPTRQSSGIQSRLPAFVGIVTHSATFPEEPHKFATQPGFKKLPAGNHSRLSLGAHAVCRVDLWSIYARLVKSDGYGQRKPVWKDRMGMVVRRDKPKGSSLTIPDTLIVSLIAVFHIIV